MAKTKEKKPVDPKKEKRNYIIWGLFMTIGAFFMPKLMEGKVLLLFHVIPLGGTLVAIIMGVIGVLSLICGLMYKVDQKEDQKKDD